jgi:hypothetical protein
VQRWLDALRQWMTANNDPRLTEGHLSEVLTASADFCEYLSGIANETVH